MRGKPVFIDNRDGNTMAEALKRVFGDVSVFDDNKHIRENDLPEEVRIASAYFSPQGFRKIANALSKIPSVRLMLGADMPLEANFQPRPVGTNEDQWQRRLLKNRLEFLQRGIKQERDQLPFTPESNHAMHALIKALRAGNLEVRRYEDKFLHAKAYIYSSGGKTIGTSGILAGSSNLTASGLTSNLELNLSRADDVTVERAIKWFDELWEEAVPVDLADFYEETFIPQEPWFVFLRVLYQLYGAELDQEKPDGPAKLSLTTFQKHGVERTMRLIDENGGAIVADEVGLGKTFIAGEILDKYREHGQRTLLICPAALRDSTWSDFIHEHQLYCECYSYHELANDHQLNLEGDQICLKRDKDEYQLIIIDEAHNYRNPDTPARAQILRTLMFGRRKELLLLTATPVNNSLWDLHTLLSYFVRQDGVFAEQGILSMRERFKQAMRQDPADLSPDILYPIIDATTVKRTRQFVKKHYSGDTIVFGGEKIPIVFPEPIPITVRYDMEAGAENLLEKVFDALDPDEGTLTFVRYGMGNYQLTVDEDEVASSMAAIGLLRSSLLKRFESSSRAFGITVSRIREQYLICLDALAQGRVITTEFLAEISGDDEIVLEELLKQESELTLDAKLFDVDKLEPALRADLVVLDELIEAANEITMAVDPKLEALREQLEKIVEQAEEEATDKIDESDKRKVLIFSFFADTVDWVYDFLLAEIQRNPKLASLKGRIAKVSSKDTQADFADATREEVVYGFAPVSMGKPELDNLYDVLVTTDVLAEGVNLQQCRHIINYDLPWNPMRLVQRHGRIDRIGSKHKRVFLRSIFPDAQLDDLLKLEQRILDKIAMAAATIGVQGPVEGIHGGSQVFTETREELEEIISENPEFYERGGSVSAAQSGEEYRQTLRKALQDDPDKIVNMPWRAGSGMRRGKERGIFFSGFIDERPQWCFVKADEQWQPIEGKEGIEAELGTCLRLIEAEENTSIELLISEDQIYPFWDRATEHFYHEWEFRTDPANLAPKTRKLNGQVIEFLSENIAEDVPVERLRQAISILSSEWSRRDEKRLRDKFSSEEKAGIEKAREIIEWVLDTGIPPVEVPKPLEPITREDVRLLCWMVIEPEIEVEVN